MNAVEERDQIRSVMQSRAEAIERLQSIRASAEAALRDGSSVITMALTRESAPTAERIHLAGHGGPLGELVNAKPVGSAWQVVGTFKCAAVIAWATKQIETLLLESLKAGGIKATVVK